MKALNTETFQELISRVKRETGSDLESVGMSATYQMSSISFAFDSVTNSLQIEDFGFKKGNKWIQLEPTKEQKETLLSLIEKEVEIVEQENKVEFSNYDVRDEQGLFGYGY